MALVFDYSSFEDWIGEPQELTSGTIPDNECRENAGRSIVQSLGHLNNLVNQVFANVSID
jgi:hypothetical protein